MCIRDSGGWELCIANGSPDDKEMEAVLEEYEKRDSRIRHENLKENLEMCIRDRHIEEFPKMRIHLLEEVYPMGDEVVLIYEATGRVVRPGGLPIEQGVAVFNVETIYRCV